MTSVHLPRHDVTATHERAGITSQGKPAAALVAVDDLGTPKKTLGILADTDVVTSATVISRATAAPA